MDGFPERYSILPPSVERVLEVAQRFGHFMFGAVNPEVAYPSDHRRIPEPSATGAAAMLDRSLYEPTDGEPIVIERTDIAQLDHTGGRWSDMGTY